MIGPDIFLQSRTEQITALARRHAVPTVTPYREFDVTEESQGQVERIFAGISPLDTSLGPVLVQPTC